MASLKLFVCALVLLVLAASGVDGRRRKRSYNLNPAFKLDKQIVINLGSGGTARGIAMRLLGPDKDNLKTYPTDIVDLRPPQTVANAGAIPRHPIKDEVALFKFPGQTYYWVNPDSTSDDDALQFCTVSIDGTECTPEDVKDVETVKSEIDKRNKALLDGLTADSRIYIAGHGSLVRAEIADDVPNRWPVKKLADLIATPHVKEIFAKAPLRISLIVCQAAVTLNKVPKEAGVNSVAGNLALALYKNGVNPSVLGRFNDVQRVPTDAESYQGPTSGGIRHNDEYLFTVVEKEVEKEKENEDDAPEMETVPEVTMEKRKFPTKDEEDISEYLEFLDSECS